jgi:hypothetical protein
MNPRAPTRHPNRPKAACPSTGDVALRSVAHHPSAFSRRLVTGATPDGLGEDPGIGFLNAELLRNANGVDQRRQSGSCELFVLGRGTVRDDTDPEAMQPQTAKRREYRGIRLKHLRIFRPVPSNQISNGFSQTKAFARSLEEAASRREAVRVGLAKELNGIDAKAAVRCEETCPLPKGQLSVNQRIVKVEEDESSRTIAGG